MQGDEQNGKPGQGPAAHHPGRDAETEDDETCDDGGEVSDQGICPVQTSASLQDQGWQAG